MLAVEHREVAPRRSGVVQALDPRFDVGGGLDLGEHLGMKLDINGRARQQGRSAGPSGIELGEDGGQVGNQAILAERGEHDDAGKYPESSAAQSAANSCSGVRGMVLAHSDGVRAIAHQQRSQRQTQQRDTAQHEVGVTPSMMLNYP